MVPTKGKSKQFFFNLDEEDFDQVMRRLTALAAHLGYFTSRFPRKGHGNVPPLLVELVSKDTLVIIPRSLLRPEPGTVLAAYLENYAAALQAADEPGPDEKDDDDDDDTQD